MIRLSYAHVYELVASPSKAYAIKLNYFSAIVFLLLCNNRKKEAERK